MSKRRIKFSKLGMGKFISHLDLLRAFTRAITRAGLPVRYSNGFNPHQIITFSLPLAVGVTSECEYTDIDFEPTVSDALIMEKLNMSLPPDLRVLSVGEPLISANDICAAEYNIKLEKCMLSEKILDEFYGQDEIAVVKKTKKGEKTVNLKDYIKGFEVVNADDKGAELNVILSAGGQANIKPALLTEKILEFANADDEAVTLIHRKKIFYEDKKENKKELLIFC